MKRVTVIAGLLALTGLALNAQRPTDWPGVGNDPGGMKYSPLTQITPGNVATLKQVWTFDTQVPATGWRVTPLVVNNVMYFPTLDGKVVALKADPVRSSGDSTSARSLTTPAPPAAGSRIGPGPGRSGRAS